MTTCSGTGPQHFSGYVWNWGQMDGQHGGSSGRQWMLPPDAAIMRCRRVGPATWPPVRRQPMMVRSVVVAPVGGAMPMRPVLVRVSARKRRFEAEPFSSGAPCALRRLARTLHAAFRNSPGCRLGEGVLRERSGATVARGFAPNWTPLPRCWARVGAIGTTRRVRRSLRRAPPPVPPTSPNPASSQRSAPSAARLRSTSSAKFAGTCPSLAECGPMLIKPRPMVEVCPKLVEAGPAFVETGQVWSNPL